MAPERVLPLASTTGGRVRALARLTVLTIALPLSLAALAQPAQPAQEQERQSAAADIAPASDPVTAPTPTPAPAPPPRLRMSGFGTVGVVHMVGPKDTGFVRDPTQPSHTDATRVDTDSRLGLQLDYAISDTLSAMAQVIVRRRAPDASSADSLEWALLKWRPVPQATVRLGRMSGDMYFLADVRNVGIAYPMARPQHEYYGMLTVPSFDGMDASYALDIGESQWIGKLSYGIPRQLSSSTPDGGHFYSTFDRVASAMLSWERQGFKLRGVILQVSGVRNHRAELDQLRLGLAQVSQMPGLPAAITGQASEMLALTAASGTRIYTLGASYEDARWQVMIEGTRVMQRAYAGKSGYAMVARRFGEFTAYGASGFLLGRGRSFEGPPQWGPPGSDLYALGMGAYQAVQAGEWNERSVTAGLRWDFSSQAALKLQVDRYRIRQPGAYLWRNPPPTRFGATVWTAVVDFIF